MDEDDDIGRLRGQALDTIGDNAVALGLPPAGDPASATVAEGDAKAAVDGRFDAPFQVALTAPERAWVRAGMRGSGAAPRFDRTIGQLTSGEFTPDEIKALEDRALTKAGWGDVLKLTGVVEGSPVVLNAEQKATIDRLMGQIGSDEIANRARAAYGRALNGGRIRVR